MKNIREIQRKSGKRYVVTIRDNKKSKYIGTFKTLEDAIIHRDNALKLAHKEAKIQLNNQTKIEKIYQDWRNDPRYHHWIQICIERDKCCQICQSIDHLNVHHLKNGEDHPKYRFDIDNGITLCRSCHTAFHCSYKNSFREKCTEKDWYNFLELLEHYNIIKQ